MIARVLNQLDAAPLALEIPMTDTEPVPYLLQKRDMQQFTAALVMDPVRVVWILDAYKGLDDGDSSTMIALLQRAIDPSDTSVTFRPMTYLMDVASGSGPERRAMIEAQAKTRSEEHTSELQSHSDLVCRLLLEKKKKKKQKTFY